MSPKLQPVRGTKDVYGEIFERFEAIVNAAKEVTSLYGFSGIQTPIFEFTDVFARTLGDVSDIVSKEMYSFSDRNDESLTLRPEFTASIVRSFISNGMQQNLPLKFFSYGPVFRYERPQKGRQRQFHQLNCEMLGMGKPEHDAELISMAAHLLERLGCKNLRLDLNSLGDKESRSNYRSKLVEYLTQYESDLSEDSKVRLQKNPLRILDSKDEKDRQILEDAPTLENYYTDDAKNFFESLKSSLDALNVKYVHAPKLVRGLDYYCHTAFEFITEDLGAQGTVLAGGRYDGLIEQMGGPATPATGFAAGIERLIEIGSFNSNSAPAIVVTHIDDASIESVIKTAQSLRKANIKAESWLDGNFGKRLRKANSKNIQTIIIIGEEERLAGQVKLKNMQAGTEIAISNEKLIDYLNKQER